MFQINIKGLPEVLHPLGSLVCQETFTVITENKAGSHIFRNKQQVRLSTSAVLPHCSLLKVRHVLLYENQLIFCKQLTEKGGAGLYQFKFSLAIANLGMSSLIKVK